MMQVLTSALDEQVNRFLQKGMVLREAVRGGLALLKPEQPELTAPFIDSVLRRCAADGYETLFVAVGRPEEHPLLTISAVFEARLSAKSLDRLPRSAATIQFSGVFHRYFAEHHRPLMLVIDGVDSIYRHLDSITIMSAMRSAFSLHSERMTVVFLMDDPKVARQMFKRGDSPLHWFADVLNEPATPSH